MNVILFNEIEFLAFVTSNNMVSNFFLPLVTENTKACIHVYAHAHVEKQLRN